jgi:hypothetical protein
VHPGDDSHPDTPDGVCQPGTAPPAAPPRAARRHTPTAAAAPAGDGGISADPAKAIAGLETTTARTGEDTRRRGWYWHWNHIVTQYAPLIGLEGVGLLNSYTVWTDRREESPLRGYAFPSQQSEASFYGQDRAELITINKILVALDLIEIRKEMVVRADEQGRRWRVPHNLYRVKDHGDGANLTVDDVLRVVELADRDRAVYRRVRHIFSARFAPIDAQNVWWRILDDLAANPTWLRLAARVAAEETRATARTKAGHAARKGGFFVPADGDTATPGDTDNDSGAASDDGVATTSVAPINSGLAVGVAPGNDGSGVAVAPANSGSTPGVGGSNSGSGRRRPSMVAGVDNAPPTSVEPVNTTKDQDVNTTTTTTTTSVSAEKMAGTTGDSGTPAATEPAAAAARMGDESAAAVAPVVATGPGERPAPGDGPGEAAAIRAFEEANGRPSTPAEQRLLREIAAQIDAAAQTSRACGGSGWGWVAAAAYEAVEAGSAFVAPRRLREIVGRWSREGAPGEVRAARVPQARPAASATAMGVAAPARTAAGDAPAQAAAGTEGVARGSRLVAESATEAAEAIAGPVEPGVFHLAECGMNSAQVWAATLAELQVGAALPADEVASWVRPARLLARRADGVVVIGAPNPLAQRRLATRYGHALATALARVIGGPVAVEVVVTPAWMAAQAASGEGAGEAEAPAS